MHRLSHKKCFDEIVRSRDLLLQIGKVVYEGAYSPDPRVTRLALQVVALNGPTVRALIDWPKELR